MSNEYIRDDRLADGLSKALSEAREDAGLSGKELSALTGLTQPRISRVEGGKAKPRIDEIEKWAAATHLDQAQIEKVLALHAEYEAWESDLARRTSYGVAGSEIEYTSTFKATKLIRTFALTEIPGYLQTREYARQVIDASAPGSPQDERNEALGARLERAEYLGKRGKRFSVVIAESALHWQMGDPDAMRGQIGHLFNFFGTTGVDLAVLPMAVRARPIPRHGFTIHDEQFVRVELFGGAATLRHREPQRYGEVMKGLLAQAVQGDDARDLLSKALSTVPTR